MANKVELHAQGMDPATRGADDGRHGSQRRRAQRPVRNAQGKLRHRQAAGAGKSDATANELVKAVAGDYETAEGRKAASDGLRAKLGGEQPGDIKTMALDGLRQVAALLAAKAPADAAAFKPWLGQISQNVAEAASEGGFLGFGGVQASDAEKATLAEISTALA